MPRAAVVYDSKWGNTQQVAAEIAAGIREAGAQADLIQVRQATPENLAGYDAILIGSPNHFGTATAGIRRLINRLGRPVLAGRLVTFFDTCLPREELKAARRMEQRARRKAPGLAVVAPELSVRVRGMKGPLREGELEKARGFGQRVAGWLKTGR